MSSSIEMLDVIFFFFQAEDGIRDVAVTGVQTCALPICEGDRETDPHLERWVTRRAGLGLRGGGSSAGVDEPARHRHDVAGGGRSEERRVGKECRSRWSPYH